MINTLPMFFYVLEHYGILVIYNQAWCCKASLMLSRVCVGQEERKLQDCRKMKAREVTSTKSCQMTFIHRPIPSRGYGEERKDVSDKGFKISFKVNRILIWYCMQKPQLEPKLSHIFAY